MSRGYAMKKLSRARGYEVIAGLARACRAFSPPCAPETGG